MAMIKTRDDTEIFYKDWGSGQPIVVAHEWPFNAGAWDNHSGNSTRPFILATPVSA